MRWLIRLAVVIAVIGTASPAYAAIKVKSTCDNGWYVNDDEGSLVPTQVPAGLVFDGPSLVHHATTPVTLADTPTDGAFTHTGAVTGVLPLFKMETTTPYSTINKTPAGKYWSSKIAAGPGSQSSPVDSPADLLEIAPYNGNTHVYSFGVGYANDVGNKATITSVTFGQHTYTMACAPVSSAPPSSAPVTPTLPVTGFPTGAAVALGFTAIVAGLVLVRRHRMRFEA